jgi:hypothetical protein
MSIQSNSVITITVITNSRIYIFGPVEFVITEFEFTMFLLIVSLIGFEVFIPEKKIFLNLHLVFDFLCTFVNPLITINKYFENFLYFTNANMAVIFFCVFFFNLCNDF